MLSFVLALMVGQAGVITPPNPVNSTSQGGDLSFTNDSYCIDWPSSGGTICFSGTCIAFIDGANDVYFDLGSEPGFLRLADSCGSTSYYDLRVDRIAPNEVAVSSQSGSVGRLGVWEVDGDGADTAGIIRFSDGTTGIAFDTSSGNLALRNFANSAFASITHNGFVSVATSRMNTNVPLAFGSSFETQLRYDSGDSRLEIWSPTLAIRDASDSSSGTISMGRSVSTGQAQLIDSVGETVSSAKDVVLLTADANYTLTATPTISAGLNNQVVVFLNTDTTETLTFQDESNLAGSTLQLSGGVDFTLGPGDTLTMVFSSTTGDWHEISRSDN